MAEKRHPVLQGGHLALLYLKFIKDRHFHKKLV